MAHNIVLITWPNDSKPYEVYSQLKNEDIGQVNQAGVVKRDEDGRVSLRDADSKTIGIGTLGGGALGSLIGILGGPVGVLLGFAGGALFGMIADSDAAVADDTVIASISKQLPPGATGLLLDVDESNPAVLDRLVADSGGIISRYDYEETLSEIMSAEDAAEAASDEARRVIKENKKAERKAEREEKWGETKQKFKNFFHVS